MGPIRELLSRIRERRMERMGSRQGLFPRLRNLINPLDSQSMMDRAQGTKVGTASPAPLSYSKRLFPSTSGGPATGAPNVAGKPGRPPDAATADLESLTPPQIGDLKAQFEDAQNRGRIARKRAEVPGQTLEVQGRLIAEATYYERQAQQLNHLFTQKGIADSLKPKPALTGQFESEADVEKRLFSGQITPAAGAQVVFDSKQAGLGDARLVGPEAAAEKARIQSGLTMTFVAGQMTNGQVPTPGTPLGAQFKAALDTLPAEQRQPFVTASLGPHLIKSYIGRIQASVPNGRELDMVALHQDASTHAQAELAKIDPSFYVDAKSGSMSKFFGNVFGGAKQLGGQVLSGAAQYGQNVRDGASSVLEDIMARPAADAAPPAGIPPLLPATPVAKPVPGPAFRRPKPIPVK